MTEIKTDEQIDRFVAQYGLSGPDELAKLYDKLVELYENHEIIVAGQEIPIDGLAADDGET